MPQHLYDIQARLAQLHLDLAKLHQHLEAATLMAGQGRVPPAAALVTELIGTQQAFGEIQDGLDEVAAVLHLPPGPAVDDLATIAYLTERAAYLADAAVERAAQDARRTQAIAVLDRVLQLAHRDTPGFAPLLACQETARQLRADLEADPAGNPAALATLADSTHPLAQLLALVELRDELPDEAWTQADAVVTAAFDRLLAVAAERGKLRVVTADAAPRQASPAPVAHPASPEIMPVVVGVGTATSAEWERPVPDLGNETSWRETDSVSAEMITQPAETAEDHVFEVAVDLAAPTDLPGAVDERDQQGGWAPPDEAATRLPVTCGTTTTNELPSATDEAVEPGFGAGPGETGDLPPISSTEEPIAFAGAEGAPEESVPAGPGIDSAPSIDGVGEAGAPPVPDYAFSAMTPAPEIARTLRTVPTEARGPGLRDLLWALMREGEMGLAFHLARSLEALYPTPPPLLPSWIVRAVALGPHIRYENSPIAHQLQHDFAQFSEACFLAGAAEWNQAVRLLLTAAALRPALLAPTTGAAHILFNLRAGAGLTAFHQLCAAIAEHGAQGYALDFQALRRAKDAGAWAADVTALQEETQRWVTRGQQATLLYAPATHLWHRWLDPGGLIYALLAPVLENNPIQLARVKADAARLGDDATVRRDLDRADRTLRGHYMTDAITGRALTQLRQGMADAVALAGRWVALQEACPTPGRDYLLERADQLQREVCGQRATVLAELETLAAEHPHSLLTQAAVARSSRAVEDVGCLFDPAIVLPAEEVPPAHLLHADLLRSVAISFSGEWEPRDPAGSLLDPLLALVDEHPDWAAAFTARGDSGDHLGTQYILEYLEQTRELAPAERARWQEQRQQGLAEYEAALARDLRATRQKVDAGAAEGLLRESERNALLAGIEQIERNLKSHHILQFAGWHAELRAIERRITDQQTLEIERVRDRLNSTVLPTGDDYGRSRRRITDLLTAGDLLTANEYIDMLARGLSLPPTEAARSALSDFFPDRARAVDSAMDRVEPKQLIEVVQQGRSFAGLEFGQVPGAQRQEAVVMLRAWLEMKRSKSLSLDEVRTRLPRILVPLGFTPRPDEITISSAVPDKQVWVNLVTELLTDRARCPVPAYGSLAAGRYRLLCVWDRPAEEDLLAAVGETVQQPPVLVFHFGRMTEQRRRGLARLCRQQRRTLIVLDDTLLFYLCAQRGARLPVFFECALPFTHMDPYTTTAGLVPPEMFYGRQQERDSLMNLMGSCFVYGGRQLGKTALLRDVERTFHQPAEGRIALWLDLKALGIGYDRPLEDLWEILAAEFKRLGILPSGLSARSKADRLLDQIQRWLNDQPGRRILLLLDEADRFLESDGQRGSAAKGTQGEFLHAARLKGLMDRTERRFKVVFAGLHNVQRTTRLANHPLAHYGRPLQIGPLLDNEEWRAARALIERPTGVLGFQFRTPDLVTRILSQTNYYPSLLQLYGHHLLQHMINRPFDPKNSPPYDITSDRVEDAYRSTELRKAIRDRILWTLDLDPRYRVIAFAIAWATLAAGEEAPEGYLVGDIRKEVLTFWEVGFRDVPSEDAFRVLLDEMVGLGILRAVDGNRYALRNPNVVALLGTQEEIEAELLSNAEREPPLVYEAATFHSAYRRQGQVEPARRSPLTAQQEADLRVPTNGVSLIFGCPASGLEVLPEFLELAFGQEIIQVDDVSDRAAFARRLAALGEKRTRDTVTLVLVSARCAWTVRWVEEAVGWINRLHIKDTFVRVVFVADPLTTWTLTSMENDLLEQLITRGVSTLTLRPWHDTALRQWLEDNNFAQCDKAARERITAVTGNWPRLLRAFYDKARADLPRWESPLTALEEELAQPPRAREELRALGVRLPAVRPTLDALHALDEASVAELASVLEGSDLLPVPVDSSVQWADRLGLVTLRAREVWQLDPFAARMLTVANSES